MEEVPIRVGFCTVYECGGDASDIQRFPLKIVVRVVFDQNAVLIVDPIIERVIKEDPIERNPKGPDHVHCKGLYRGVPI